MELYIIRHGIAQERSPGISEVERSLTKEGRQKTEKIAKRLHNLAVEFDLILTSPLVRARQTAEILLEHQLSSQLETTDHLTPGGDIYAWLREWWEPQQHPPETSIALVGHEPSLSQWTEILLWGEVKERLVLKKAGIIGLTVPVTGSPVGCAQLFWLTPPKFLL